jgi:bleomycin hydrolase
MNTIMPGLDINDFVSLSHVPTKDLEFNRKYEIKWTKNVSEGQNCTLLNVHIDELSKYAIKSITAGFAVWFAADVMQHFNFIHSSLDDQLDDSHLIFKESYKFNKGERITLRNVQGNHAMALTGVNLDQNGIPINWQVENSWGYWDHETPGLDGFLTMSHSWFKKYIMEVVIHKMFLSRTFSKLLDQQPVLLNPWNSMAPATRVGNVDAPRGYRKLHGNTKLSKITSYKI